MKSFLWLCAASPVAILPTFLLTSVGRAQVVSRIPVVVHVLEDPDGAILADGAIHRQLRSLSKDFSGLNEDLGSLDPFFSAVAGHPSIEFVLASRTPSGGPTRGIIRYRTSYRSFPNSPGTIPDVYSGGSGGVPAWDTLRYLNIWVVPELTDRSGSQLLNGTARRPSDLGNLPNSADGILVSQTAFGVWPSQSSLVSCSSFSSRRLGRTLTHEAGHYLDLEHIWGDDQTTGCLPSDDDGVADTPSQRRPTDPCFVGIKASCTARDMINNFMDYSHDELRVAFTRGQSGIMRGVLLSHPLRHGLVPHASSMVAADYPVTPDLDGDTFFRNSATHENAQVVVMGDRDSDGIKDVLLEAGARVVALGGAQHQSEIWSLPHDPSVVSVTMFRLGRVDGDEHEDLAILSVLPDSFEASFTKSRVELVSGASGAPLTGAGGTPRAHVPPPSSPGRCTGSGGFPCYYRYISSVLDCGFVDADAADDYAIVESESRVTDYESSDGFTTVTMYSGVDGAPLWVYTSPRVNGGPDDVSSVPLGDLNGDGVGELALGFRGVGGPFVHNDEGHVVVLDGRTGTVLRSHSGVRSDERLGSAMGRLGDIDGDGVSEYVISTGPISHGFSQPRMLIYSGASGAVSTVVSGRNGALLDGRPSPVRDCTVGDVDFDGVRDLLCSAGPGTGFEVLSGTDQRVLFAWAGSFTSVEGAGDVNGDGRGDVVLCRRDPVGGANAAVFEVLPLGASNAFGFPDLVGSAPLLAMARDSSARRSQSMALLGGRANDAWFILFSLRPDPAGAHGIRIGLGAADFISFADITVGPTGDFLSPGFDLPFPGLGTMYAQAARIGPGGSTEVTNALRIVFSR